MFKSTRKSKMVKVASAAAAIGSIAAIGLVGNSPANADPKQFAADIKVGVGSDTTQDVLNALAGHSNGTNYTPIQGGPALTQVLSFDATGGPCITAKLNGPSFDRPNGSSAGRRALSRAIDGAVYGSAACGGARAVTGQIDFARSSGLGTLVANGPLTYIPFGRDGLSYAAFRQDGNPVTSLTKAQLTAAFSTAGGINVGGTRIIACGIQTQSGTYGSWNTAVGVNATQEDTATTECNGFLGRAQENDGPDLAARGAAADAAVNGTQVIVGFSAGSYISKFNGAALPAPGPGVQIGSITDNGNGVDLGSPVVNTAGVLTPAPDFFNDTTFGRFVYNVVPTSRIDSAFGNDDLKALFKGPTSKVCAETATLRKFGFLPIPTCGDTGTKGSLQSGTF